MQLLVFREPSINAKETESRIQKGERQLMVHWEASLPATRPSVVNDLFLGSSNEDNDDDSSEAQKSDNC